MEALDRTIASSTRRWLTNRFRWVGGNATGFSFGVMLAMRNRSTATQPVHLMVSSTDTKTSTGPYKVWLPPSRLNKNSITAEVIVRCVTDLCVVSQRLVGCSRNVYCTRILRHSRDCICGIKKKKAVRKKSAVDRFQATHAHTAHNTKLQ